MHPHPTTSATRTQVQEDDVRVLHLRPSAPDSRQQPPLNRPRPSPRVRWTDDVVDNEDMGKKKSKICCIFHPQREFGESSDESLGSSSDSSSDDSGTDSNRTKPCCKHNHQLRKQPKKSLPNAYEKQPHYKNQSVAPPR